MFIWIPGKNPDKSGCKERTFEDDVLLLACGAKNINFSNKLIQKPFTN
ncbi:MAG: hypothetical protein L0Y76_02140 [Ignavibacteria bacterium]|nr:hypothetical protein [Ignavibacteria bacterium]